MSREKTYKGSAAFTVVLVMTVILISAGVVLILTSMDLGNSTKELSSGNFAKVYAINCEEEALYKIAFNRTFTGVITVDDGTMSCSATVADDAANPSQKIISINSLYDGHQFNEKVTVDTTDDIMIVGRE